MATNIIPIVDEADRPARTPGRRRTRTSPGNRETADRARTARASTQYITTPASHLAEHDLGFGHGQGEERLDRARAALLGQQSHGEHGDGHHDRDPEGRAPRDVEAHRVAQARELALRLAQGVDHLPEVEEGDDLKRQKHQVGHRAQKVGPELACDEVSDVSHDQIGLALPGRRACPGSRSGRTAPRASCAAGRAAAAASRWTPASG